MKNITAIFSKELKGYFNSPIAYIFLTVFLSLSSWIFFKTFFINNEVVMTDFFDIIPWLYLFFIPALSMRLWSEEKKQGTLELLFTSPVNDIEAVIAKFLGSFAFLLLSIGLTFSIPLTLVRIGHPDIGQIFTGYVGTLLLGGSYLAIGMWISSLTENQIVAFILSVVISFLFFLSGESFFLLSLPEYLRPFFEVLGLGTHFNSISRGVIDSRDIIYYLSFISFFLYLNIKSLETRYYRG